MIIILALKVWRKQRDNRGRVQRQNIQEGCALGLPIVGNNILTVNFKMLKYFKISRGEDWECLPRRNETSEGYASCPDLIIVQYISR